MTLPSLSPAHLNRRPQPRILQFGGGNFLRGFMDWKIDRLNEASGSDWGVVILRSLGSTDGSALNAQGGLYTVVSRGIGADGTAQSHSRLVGSVLAELSCATDWDRVVQLARNPMVEVILSNTTEAGITYVAGQGIGDAPPASFPAKLTRLLVERWRALGHLANMGWQVLPCELTENCGDKLRDLVLRHATEWAVGQDCLAWIAEQTVFYNTLVDRIVTGHPAPEALEELEQSLGYRDPCLTTAELFHLLVIESPPDKPAFKLRLAEHDTGTIEVPDAAPYRLRKVAILNGAHTALCPLALLCGVQTVGEAMAQPTLLSLLHRVLAEEIKPFVPLPQADLDAFADDVLRRFANPFIQHRWYDISLNGLAKYRDRLLGRVLAYQTRHAAPPPILSLSLAGWLVFYLGRFDGAQALSPRDQAPVLALIAHLRGLPDTTAIVTAFLADISLWGQSIATPDLVATVAADFDFLTQQPASFAALLAITSNAYPARAQP